ncbi:uncharacterized protein LOC141670895 isoform X2 [Apium graveolens]|uniref:uncharacterized protein LOC141670895 isoform X2 n=1 Tax=Apium graveolens TaxID=4045 RepID=UPI003D7BDBED
MYHGGFLIGRTLAVLVTMTVATFMAARDGPVPVAGYQICLEVWLALSLLNDALVIAGQDSPIRIPAKQFLTLRAFDSPPIVIVLAAIVIVSFWHIEELVMNLVVSMMLGLLDVFCGWNL